MTKLLTNNDINNYESPIERSSHISVKIQKYSQNGSPSIREYKELLCKKQFRVSDTDNTYRIIHSWGASGLLLDDNDGGWRQFSIIDLVWIRIITEMREIGMEKDKILTLKESLFVNGDTSCLEYYIMEVFYKKEVIIVVNNQGHSSLATEEEFQFSQYKIVPLPVAYITISLNKIYKELLTEESITKKSTRLVEVLPEFRNIIDAIQKHNADEVLIRASKGKIRQTDIKQRIHNTEKAMEKIQKMITSGKYRDIIIKIENEHIVLIEEITKSK